MSDDHIPQGYIPLSELLDRYIRHIGAEQTTINPRSFAEREKWLAPFEDELVAAFRVGALTALYRLPGSEENKVVRPEEWDALSMPSRPFLAKVLAFSGDAWFKFHGRTLFIEEAAATQWLDELSGAHPGPKQVAVPAHRPPHQRDAAIKILRALTPEERGQKRESLLELVNLRMPDGQKISLDTLRRALRDLDNA